MPYLVEMGELGEHGATATSVTLVDGGQLKFPVGTLGWGRTEQMQGCQQTRKSQA